MARFLVGWFARLNGIVNGSYESGFSSPFYTPFQGEEVWVKGRTSQKLNSFDRPKSLKFTLQLTYYRFCNPLIFSFRKTD